MNTHELIPDPHRLIKSLRDMGYDFAQAVADIVDNSIEAEAKHIAITFRFEGDDTWLRIADDGHGMAPQELRDAMRYGSSREYSEDDLGKFGLGLKTASMSQCQVLTVASRRSVQRRDIAAYSWDLDHIKKSRKWQILEVSSDDPMFTAIRESLEDHTGTVVMWRKLDRILGYSHPYGESARKRSLLMAEDLMTHLGMVFHRFLAGEVRGKRIAITVNGHEVHPWDPFCRTGEQTVEGDPISLPVSEDGIRGTILLQSYVLPSKDEFSSTSAFERAAGPAGWNQQQGLYIYRGGRMIQSGGWSHLRKADEHVKLARISVSFKPELDDLFKVNVAKMRVQIPAAVREQVREFIGAAIVRANDRYRRTHRSDATLPPVMPSVSATVEPNAAPQHTPAEPASHADSLLPRDTSPAPSLPPAPEAHSLVSRIIAEATALERPHVTAVLRRLRLLE